MIGRDLVRSVTAARVGGPGLGLRAWRAAVRARRAEAEGSGTAERARVPGAVTGVEPEPGGGLIRFGRSALYVRVTVRGAVFLGWDGARPAPSYALAGEGVTEPDERVLLEPDTEGGFRIVAERVTLTVSRRGTVEVCTPGGVVLRRDEPPRWWERSAGPRAPRFPFPAGDAGRVTVPGRGVPPRDGAPGTVEDGEPPPRPLADADRDGPSRGQVPSGREPGGPGAGGGRWEQRSEVSADARFFGSLADGGPARTARGGAAPGGGFRLVPGAYPLGARDGAGGLRMPVQVVVADAGAHLVFHDTTGEGTLTVRDGVEGAGSGHDRPAVTVLGMRGGPVRYWIVVGPPQRLAYGWASLTGAPLPPPDWALGHHHEPALPFGAAGVRELAEGFRARAIPLDAVLLDPPPVADGSRQALGDGRSAPTGPTGRERFPGPAALGADLPGLGVRTVAVARDRGGASHPGCTASGPGPDSGLREWRSGPSGRRLAEGFADFVHEEAGCPSVPSRVGPGTVDSVVPPPRPSPDGRAGECRGATGVHEPGVSRAAGHGLRAPGTRPFLVSDSGWAGVQRYGGVRLAPGGAADGWEALRASLGRVLGLGLCGVPFSGPRASGDGELGLRSLQLAAYLPLLCTGPGVVDEGGGDERVRAVLRERARLRPYFMTLARYAALWGAPWARPLWWLAPEDRALRDCGDAFLLGDALLVAPVLAAGLRVRSVPLPPGRWYDTVTGAIYPGSRTVEVAAPLSRPAVLARAGAVLPVRGADGATELEVWAPAEGQSTGGGTVLAGPADGGEQPVAEHYVSRREPDGRVVVERTDDGPLTGRAVRVRGLGRGPGEGGVQT
ncbi:TIM-barrel domain-containing protein [Streptomyces sp. NPDC007088]|uniref:TIM-barrel domain-containing protein n=1 Tax=Streptomyces sp. NPDC007088 TaxID=3364773 RepID=UPI00368837E8